MKILTTEWSLQNKKIKKKLTITQSPPSQLTQDSDSLQQTAAR